jgi:hypothetical protein
VNDVTTLLEPNSLLVLLHELLDFYVLVILTTRYVEPLEPNCSAPAGTCRNAIRTDSTEDVS